MAVVGRARVAVESLDHGQLRRKGSEWCQDAGEAGIAKNRRDSEPEVDRDQSLGRSADLRARPALARQQEGKRDRSAARAAQRSIEELAARKLHGSAPMARNAGLFATAATAAAQVRPPSANVCASPSTTALSPSCNDRPIAYW